MSYYANYAEKNITGKTKPKSYILAVCMNTNYLHCFKCFVLAKGHVGARANYNLKRLIKKRAENYHLRIRILI